VTRTKVYDGIVDLLREYDVLVTPTLAVTPFAHGDFPTEIDGKEVEPLRGWLLTQPFNFSGHPVGAVPAGSRRKVFRWECRSSDDATRTTMSWRRALRSSASVRGLTITRPGRSPDRSDHSKDRSGRQIGRISQQFLFRLQSRGVSRASS